MGPVVEPLIRRGSRGADGEPPAGDRLSRCVPTLAVWSALSDGDLVAVRHGVEPEIGGRRDPRSESSEYRGVRAGSSLLTGWALCKP